MNNKFLNAKTVQLGSFVMAGVALLECIFAAVFYFSVGSSLSGLGASYGVFLLFFVLLLLGSIALTVLSCINIFAKKDYRLELIVTVAVSALTVVVLLANIKLLTIGSMNFWSLLTFAASLPTRIAIIVVICIVNIALAVFNLIFMVRSSSAPAPLQNALSGIIKPTAGQPYAAPTQNFDPQTGQPIPPAQPTAPTQQFDPQTGQPVAQPAQPNQPVEQAPAAPQFDQANTQPAPQAPQSAYAPAQPVQAGPPQPKKPVNKKLIGLICGIAAAVVVLAVGGVILVNNMNTIKIDLASNATVEYYGESGEAYAMLDTNEIDYDQTNSELAVFMYTLRYEFEPAENLKNGDTVVMKVIYSEETAKSLKIKVTNDTKEFVVEGLVERFDNAGAVTSDVIDAAESLANDYVDTRQSGIRLQTGFSYLKDITIESKDVVATYLAKPSNSYSSDELVFVYAVTVKGEYRDGLEYTPGTEVVYFAVRVNRIYVDFVEDDASTYGFVVDVEQPEDGSVPKAEILKDVKSNYSLSGYDFTEK